MQSTHEPILFLDIDGVMNTTDSLWQSRGGNRFSKPAVCALRWLTSTMNIAIVITSTRRREGLESMRSLFHRNGLPQESCHIIGVTPIFADADHDDWREDEISWWLDVHPHATTFAILDDKPLATPLSHRLVLTHHDTGLTMELARMTAGLLTRA